MYHVQWLVLSYLLFARHAGCCAYRPTRMEAKIPGAQVWRSNYKHTLLCKVHVLCVSFVNYDNN